MVSRPIPREQHGTEVEDAPEDCRDGDAIVGLFHGLVITALVGGFGFFACYAVVQGGGR